MTSAREFSAEEKEWVKEINALYNAGQPEESVPKAVAFRKAFPESLMALYQYAGQHGDWAYHPSHSEEKRAELMAIAKEGFESLLNHPELGLYSHAFQRAIKNEYFYFFEKHQEQYDLGIAEIPHSAAAGNYSACVGSSLLALKSLREGKAEESRMWAQRSLEHFAIFETHAPDWYNINHFSSQAMACLGRFDEARALFKAMYRKQGKPEDALQVEIFEKKIEEITSLLQKE